mmetsp:Transcript_29085/g.94163  ORF Transcript_29085/g.94163 Transcript_29085/m.94163 type:complete len:210 (-) Transcript_29085:230-859(-)
MSSTTASTDVGERRGSKADSFAIVAAWPAGRARFRREISKKRARVLAHGILALEVDNGEACALAAADVGAPHEELQLLLGPVDHELRDEEAELVGPVREVRQVVPEEAKSLVRDGAANDRREGLLVEGKLEGFVDADVADARAHDDGQREADVERVHALDEVGKFADVVLRERRKGAPKRRDGDVHGQGVDARRVPDDYFKHSQSGVEQ